MDGEPSLTLDQHMPVKGSRILVCSLVFLFDVDRLLKTPQCQTLTVDVNTAWGCWLKTITLGLNV